MYFAHSAEIWRDFPQLVPGLLVVEGIQPAVEVEDRIEPFLERARQRLAGISEADLAEIAAWRRAYAQMGMKPTQYRSAAEALLRRFRKEDTLPRLHPLVDLCNAVSLAFALPIAVIDLDHISDYIEVRRATGDEMYLAFNGESEHPAPGEVIFADSIGHAHARRWTFRQSRRSTVTPATQRALIVSEALHPSANTDIPALLDALASEISAVWSPPTQRAILSASSPRVDL